MDKIGFAAAIQTRWENLMTTDYLWYCHKHEKLFELIMDNGDVEGGCYQCYAEFEDEGGVNG